jgi:hypothetical protein
VKNRGSDSPIADGIRFAFPKTGWVGVFAMSNTVRFFVEVVVAFTFRPSFDRKSRMLDARELGKFIAFPKAIASV